ncbi:NucA/NucB deoxyribonuclease domain-containing protein [Streptomyces hokutonensis]|uniref:NucA/NucB deoxyribonuclease domain-containing protein n=1 Tax=Streptomyces hokutonensis TaxID=1306990 RepID=UPI0033E444AD
MIVLNYSYGETGLPTTAHQIEVSAYSGWGDALNASVDGQATLSGDCTRRSASYPAKPLKPLNSWSLGEAFFDTTATGAGDIGHCATYWYLTFTNGTYTPAVTDYNINEFRCDNATAGRAVVGWVVPWYASALTYSKAATPNLVRHVQLAQGSGLPGATFAAPLTRTTSVWTIGVNRAFACPDDDVRPAGLNYDEYPLATSRNGLSAGGDRRSFAGCSLDNVPRSTGPKGASACMIPELENSSQGGTNTQFYRAERVLDGDPFRVLTTT